MRPGGAGAQHERHAVENMQIVEAGAEFASRIGRVLRVVAQPEAAAGEIGLAIAWRVEILRLQRRIRRHADDMPASGTA